MSRQRPRIGVLVSAHPVDDMRVLHREALSMGEWADVTVWGLSGIVMEWGESVRTRVISGRSGRFWRIFVAPWRIVRSASNAGADILHVHDPELLPAALLSTWFTTKHVVFDNHENYPEVMLTKTWLPKPVRPLMRFGMRMLYRLAAHRAALVIVPTMGLEESFRRLGGQVVLVRNFPPKSVFADAVAYRRECERSADFLHLGTISELRFDVFTAIMRAVWAIRPESTWIFVGLREEAIRSLSSRFDEIMSSQTTLVSTIPATEVPKYLASGRVGVNWHPDTEQFRTAIPNKVPEYLLSGMRVVTTELPELERFLPPGESSRHGVVYAERDADVFAQALVSTLELVIAGENLNLESLVEYARTTMTWDREARRLKSAYEEIVLGSEYS